MKKKKIKFLLVYIIDFKKYINNMSHVDEFNIQSYSLFSILYPLLSYGINDSIYLYLYLYRYLYLYLSISVASSSSFPILSYPSLYPSSVPTSSPIPMSPTTLQKLKMNLTKEREIYENQVLEYVYLDRDNLSEISGSLSTYGNHDRGDKGIHTIDTYTATTTSIASGKFFLSSLYTYFYPINDIYTYPNLFLSLSLSL